MRVNVLANGPSKKYFKKENPEGELLLCNIPAYKIAPSKVHGLCMTDSRFLKFLCTSPCDFFKNLSFKFTLRVQFFQICMKKTEYFSIKSGVQNRLIF